MQVMVMVVGGPTAVCKALTRVLLPPEQGMKNVFIVGAKRTPFGKYGGKMKDFTPVQMGAEAIKSAMGAGNVKPENVDSVIFGNVAQTDVTVAYLARHAALKAGLPIETPALTLNRLCGSGFQTIISGAQEIMLGDANVVVTGGAESMSQAPFAIPGSTRWGQPVRTDHRGLCFCRLHRRARRSH